MSSCDAVFWLPARFLVSLQVNDNKSQKYARRYFPREDTENSELMWKLLRRENKKQCREASWSVKRIERLQYNDKKKREEEEEDDDEDEEEEKKR